MKCINNRIRSVIGNWEKTPVKTNALKCLDIHVEAQYGHGEEMMKRVLDMRKVLEQLQFIYSTK